VFFRNLTLDNLEESRIASSSGIRRPPISRRLRVLHVGKYYPPHKGGIETHLRDLCTHLREWVDVQLVVASDSSAGSEEILDGVPVSRIPTHLTLSSAPICPGMIEKIRASDADIVHLHWPNPTAILAYLGSHHAGRLVVTYHSDTIRQRVLSSLFEPFLHAALRRSAAIITTSPDYAATSSVLSRYQARCHTIPLGIDLVELERKDRTQVDSIRRKYGSRIILGVGRLVYYKGFEHLIRAMQEVDGRLVIVGDGPLRGKLEHLAARLGLQGRVFLTGEIHGSLVPYYQAADVFCLPSVARSEAFGIVQVEAMAAGVPVVNTKIQSGVPFVSLDGETGLTVPAENPGALAAAINQLLDDPSLRRSLGASARMRAEAEFSVDVMARRTMALYDEVIAADESPVTTIAKA